MAVEFICDACGKRQEGFASRMGEYFRPNTWFQRSDDDGTQLACSRECIDEIAAKSGKTNVVLPI
jgi:hypothetical protein